MVGRRYDRRGMPMDGDLIIGILMVVVIDGFWDAILRSSCRFLADTRLVLVLFVHP